MPGTQGICSDTLRRNPSMFLAQEAKIGKYEITNLAKRYSSHPQKLLPAIYHAISTPKIAYWMPNRTLTFSFQHSI